ncbi:MAG: tetratricopeptide repeat protein [Magnetococcus sp. MYC-9]
MVDKRVAGRQRPPSLSQWLDQGLLAHQQGRLEEAARLYQQVLARHPLHPTALSNLASVHARQGNHTAALACYRKALQAGHAGAELWFNYGNLQQKLAMIPEAIHSFRTALRLQPNLYPAHYNLGNLLRDQEQLEEAVHCYEEALHHNPHFLLAYRNLGNLLRRMGRHAEAIQRHQQALSLPGQTDQQRGESHYNLANALAAAGQNEAAKEQYQAALRQAPAQRDAWIPLIRLCQAQGEDEAAKRWLMEALQRFPEESELLRLQGDLYYRQEDFAAALAIYRQLDERHPGQASTANALGVAYRALGQNEAAEAAWRRCLALDDRHGVALTNLGTLYRLKKRYEEALSCLRRAVQWYPDDPDGVSSLACTLIDLGAISEALARIEPLLTSHPDHVDLLGMKAFALVQQARIEEAQALLARARHLKPESWVAIGNTLFSSLYRDDWDAETQSRFHQQLAAQLPRHAQPPPSRPPRAAPQRRCRIGYISPDFRTHPVGLFIEPLLRHHSGERFHITCYALPYAPDETSQRLLAHAHRWRELDGWSVERMVRQIRQDEIEILVDLAGYTAGGRMDLMACRPAPVQAIFLGYPYSSGLSGMDYIIADHQLIPPHLEHLYSERVVRLAGSFLCYHREVAPDVLSLPALRNGHVTFGSFNNLPKVSSTCLDLWARVLHAVPDSRLILKASSLGDAGTRELFWGHFAARGIATERIQLLPASPPEQYMAEYGLLDIALDPFPYNGGTTSCDTVWMGVPLVTLAGEGFMSRMGASLLSTLGHPEWIATTAAEYVAIAVRLAADVEQLARIRAALRARMRGSALCDAVAYTANLESLLLEMRGRGGGHG